MRKTRNKVNKWIESLELSRKESRQIIMIIIVTVVLSMMFVWLDNQPSVDTLHRNTYGEGSKQENLVVGFQTENKGELSEERVDISMDIGELEYTEEEISEVFESYLLELDNIILGQNKSADCVYYDLNLIENLENGAIEVEWTWSPYDVLNLEGEIQQEYVDVEGTLLKLNATLSYGELEMSYIQNMCIYPEPREEKALFIEKIQSMVGELEEHTKSEKELLLPQEVEGVELKWYGEKSYRWIAIFMMGGASVLLLLWQKEEGKKKEKHQREEQMIKDYPQIIHTFALYIGAGMTVKNIWKRMISEYEEKGENRYAYEEMKNTYFEMTNGVSEIECYETFAKRCGVRCYQRFGLFLSQNVRKGTKGLTVLLEREATEAFDNRKNRARQEGEKVGTKLLMPMLLMLAVVLVIIVVPAFCSIQI